MMSSSIELSAADVQDFSEFIQEFVCKRGSCHNDMDLLARRFEVPHACMHARVHRRHAIFLRITTINAFSMFMRSKEAQRRNIIVDIF
jgi:hypothetical protein